MLRSAQSAMNDELDRSAQTVKTAVQAQQEAERRVAELELIVSALRQAESIAQQQCTRLTQAAQQVRHIDHAEQAVSEPRGVLMIATAARVHRATLRWTVCDFDLLPLRQITKYVRANVKRVDLSPYCRT